MRRGRKPAPPTSNVSRTPERSYALAAQVLGNVFTELGLSASILDGGLWDPIHIPVVFQRSEHVVDMVIFELVHGVERRRYAYNRRYARQVQRDGGTVLGQHAGFHDLFVPVGDAHASWGMLVTGPFALARPTSADLRARWRWLTGRSARLSDPEFSRYLATTLSTLTFTPQEFEAFRRFMEIFAKVLTAKEPLGPLLKEAESVRSQLQETRYIERMWAGAREMVDDGVWRSWQAPDLAHRFLPLPIAHLPEHALVGLLAGSEPEEDAIDDFLRRDTFQRACVAMARSRGHAISGRVGDHGVVFLFEDASSAARARAHANDIALQATKLARQHGLKLHVGVGAASRPFSLPGRYRSALAAAERAMTAGAALMIADEREARPAGSPLSEFRRAVVKAIADDPSVLGARFEGYLETVRNHSGYRAELTAAHLEACLDQIVDALKVRGAFDERTASELMQTLEHLSTAAVTVDEVSMAYRKVIAEIQTALAHPKAARQDQGLRRAITYIQEHFDEQLDLTRIARLAGFAPTYFSKLFVQTERMTFREYTQRLRIERAKQMLISTELSSTRVGQLCGFPTRQRFHITFKRIEQMTPHEYRQRTAG